MSDVQINETTVRENGKKEKRKRKKKKKKEKKKKKAKQIKYGNSASADSSDHRNGSNPSGLCDLRAVEKLSSKPPLARKNLKHQCSLSLKHQLPANHGGLCMLDPSLDQ